jgi:hypothetical protein
LNNNWQKGGTVMKVEQVNNVEFHPIEIKIVVETPADAKKLYALLNHSIILESLEIVPIARKIRDILSANYPDILAHSAPWFQKLVEHLLKWAEIDLAAKDHQRKLNEKDSVQFN